MSTASEFETVLSPAASIFSWSRVTGGFGQLLEHRGLHAHQPERHVHRRPADAQRRLQPRPELVPGDDVRPAELEGPVRGLGPHDPGREVGGDVVDPDRLDPLRAGPTIGVTATASRSARTAQRTAAAAEDEARPEDHVLEAGRLARPAPSATSRGSRARDPSSARSFRARDMSTNRRTPASRRRGDEVARSLAPSRAGTPRASRREARRGARRPPGPRPRAAGSPHRSCRPAPPPGSATQALRPPGAQHAHRVPASTSARTIAGPTKPCRR